MNVCSPNEYLRFKILPVMYTSILREVFEDMMENCAMVGCSTVTSSRFQMYSTSLVENPSKR